MLSCLLSEKLMLIWNIRLMSYVPEHNTVISISRILDLGSCDTAVFCDEIAFFRCILTALCIYEINVNSDMMHCLSANLLSLVSCIPIHVNGAIYSSSLFFENIVTSFY